AKRTSRTCLTRKRSSDRLWVAGAACSRPRCRARPAPRCRLPYSDEPTIATSSDSRWDAAAPGPTLLHDFDVKVSEQEHQRDQRQRGNEKRAREEDAKNSMIVLQVHVEHH